MNLDKIRSNGEFLAILDKKLKDKLKTVVFLELKKDVCINKSLYIPAGSFLPLKSEDLIRGIEDNDFEENIPFDKIINSMIFVIGSDREFPYNDDYIAALKNTNTDIESYIMDKALEYIENKDYMSALIFFNTLEKISCKPLEAGYNIANTYSHMAGYHKENNNEDDYKLYHELSYNKFLELSLRFDDSPYPYYHLGLFHREKGEYEEALKAWEKSYDRASNEEFKKALEELMSTAREHMDFEYGKNQILAGDAMEGLKKLIPMAMKHEGWTEVRYYIALGYRKLENYKKSQVILLELSEKGESFPELHNELGLCYFYLGDTKKAVEELEKAVSISGSEPGILCNLGIACWSGGHIEKARKCIKKAYEIAPEDELVRECKIWMDNQ